jgi:hypothetical protein
MKLFKLLLLFTVISTISTGATDITMSHLMVNSESGRKSAAYLSGKLQKIYGKEFQIVTGDGKNGIAVGTAADFPELKLKLSDPQEILLKTHANGIYVIGATERAVDYAVSVLLDQIGYRYYFPVEKWEIYPEKPKTKLSLNINETPDYFTRNIWPGWGLWPDYRKATNNDEEWKKVNRLGGVDLQTGHAYNRFIRQNRKEFESHPEYYALYKGERKSSKLCISNPGLRKLICDYALKTFRQNPLLESFSVDPSDGGGWCECEPCAKLGSPSDRAVILANAVAEAVTAEFPGKVIAMYAYNMHSPPPSVRVHPQIVINVATAFINEGWSVDQLIEGWKKQGATIGIREYYYAGPQPGQGKGTDMDYLQRSIVDFHKKGARYMTAESSDSWGPGGLGFYTASKLLWNVKTDVQAVLNDFFRNAFFESQMEMRKFYELIDGKKRRPLNDDLLGRMYRTLDKARQLTSNPAELSRIDSMVYYTRICELLFKLEKEQSMQSYVDLLKFAASVRSERLVHTYAMYRDDRQLLPAKLRGQKAPEINWLDSPLPTPEETAAFIKDGVANYQLLDFEPVEFSKDLRPVTFDGKSVPINFGATRWLRGFYVWSDGKPIILEITGGLIKHYRNRGNVVVQLIQIGGLSDTGELETLIQEDKSVPPDGEPRTITLTPKYTGLHRVTINDNGDMTQVKWPDNLAVSMPVDQESAQAFSGTYYFYVPKGTETLGYYAKLGRGQIVGPDGKVILDLQKTNGFYSLKIPAGMDGKVWVLRNVNGVVRLLTVPSSLALGSRFLLLPNEIVKRIK